MSGPCSCQTHYVFTAHGTKRECERLFNAAIHALRAHGEQTFVWEDQVKRLLYDRLHAWGSLRLREEQLYRSAQRATAPIVTACPPIRMDTHFPVLCCTWETGGIIFAAM
jgi:hypothetical protein